MAFNLEALFGEFQTEGSFLKGELYGSGHIHDTFLVETAEAGIDNYILQRLNNLVFRNIPELQSNIERVTNHIRNKLLLTPGADLKRECLTLVRSVDGNTWFCDTEGNYWRMYVYIPGLRSYNVVDSPEKAFEGGRAIGKFQAMLADMEGGPLFETIPYFHNVEKRLESFEQKIKDNQGLRVREVSEEIAMIRDRAEKMKTILRLGKEGKIPVRITHNDTKFNNILLDENDKARCVIDLDTVMPGYVHYDFGDSIRTVANTSREDEKDFAKINMDLSLFTAYSDGYLSEAAGTLNDTEIEYLAFAPQLITYIMALRFLTDYIDGDKYFKIHHEHHNLDRARSQLSLVKSMENQFGDMRKVISKIAGRQANN